MKGRAVHVLSNFDRYPYTRALVRVDTLMLYRYTVGLPGPDDGDVYDAHQVSNAWSGNELSREYDQIVGLRKRCLQSPSFVDSRGWWRARCYR